MLDSVVAERVDELDLLFTPSLDEADRESPSLNEELRLVSPLPLPYEELRVFTDELLPGEMSDRVPVERLLVA